MDNKWSLQDAKNKFSEVVNQAVSGKPQYVTKRGVEAVVVVKASDYQALVQPKKKMSMRDFLLTMPKGGDDFESTDLEVNEVDFK